MLTLSLTPALRTANELHASGIAQYKLCRRLFGWANQNRRNLTPKTIYAPFFTGTAVHYCLEQLYAVGTPHREALEQFRVDQARELGDVWYDQRASIEEQLEQVTGILDHYMLWVAKDRSPWNDANLEMVATEQHFTVPVRTPKGRVSSKMHLAGRFDGLVRSKVDGKLYLWEIKTCRSITERINQLDTEEQPQIYMLAAQELLGEPVAGVIYQLIRKKVPVVPALLKDGTLSQDKRQDTTPEWYMYHLRANYSWLNEAQFKDVANRLYGSFLQGLVAEPNKYFRRIVIRRTQEQLKRFSDDLYAVGSEMINPRIPLYPHGGRHCNYCTFREPCIAMNTGGDYEAMLAHNYVPNTYHQLRAKDVV